MNNRWRRIAKYMDKKRIYKIRGGGIKRPEVVFDINGGLFTVAYKGRTYKSPSFRKEAKHYAVKHK